VADLEQAIPKCNLIRQSHAPRSLPPFNPLNASPDILSVTDFFQPQPINNADVFFLSAVAHNWADGPFIKILKNLHDAVMLETELVIVDWILPYIYASTLAEDVPVLYQ